MFLRVHELYMYNVKYWADEHGFGEQLVISLFVLIL